MTNLPRDYTGIVQFSGGVGSFIAAKRVVAKNNSIPTLLFCDTFIEDDDLYRFLIEAACNVGGIAVPDGVLPLYPHAQAAGTMAERRQVLKALAEKINTIIPYMRWIYEGRDVWQIYEQHKYLGNSRIDPCSKSLKRVIADRWFKSKFGFNPVVCVRYVGIDIFEDHRYRRLVERLAPWRVEAPLLEKPYLGKQDMIRLCEAEGIAPPALYALGFAHNNCGGFCCKAGKGHFINLLEKIPDRYAYHERKEIALIEQIGKPVSILRETVDGQKVNITLQELRQRHEAGEEFNRDEQGGCGCMADDEEEKDDWYE